MKPPLNFKHLLLACVFITSVMCAQTYNKVPKVTFRYNELLAGTAKTLFVRGTNLASCMTGQPINSQLKKATVNVMFNWNTDYLAASTNTYNLSYTIIGYSSYTGTSGEIIRYTSNVIIDNTRPQAYASIDFTGLYTTINRFVVTPVLTMSGINNTQVHGFVMSDVYYSEEFEYDVTNVTTTANPITITGDNLVTFSWTPQCQLNGVPPDYEFQLLKLNNYSYATATDDRNINAVVDWKKALTIETGNSLTQLSLTMAEGTGYYLWRVRPIGNAYEGGIANDRNWGTWTDVGTYVQGANLNITTGASPYLFYFSYNQYDFYNPALSFNTASYPGSTYSSINDANRNWIFSRMFVEGDAINNGQVTIGESIGYANRLQMANQQQSRIVSENKKVVSQSFYDYAGRNAMSVLPTPVNKPNLSYEPQFIKNALGNSYSAFDFDHSFGFAPSLNNFKNPTPMDSAYATSGINPPSNYYSALNTLEDYVPTAAGYPYTRTLFSRDGKNTAIETSMPGKDHQINNTTTKHTTRHMESGVADMEIVRVFGDEAPDESTVIKTINIDPNNSASVTYVTKDGKTIATCLSGPTPGNLTPLASAAQSPFPVTATITAHSSQNGEYSLHSFKTLALAEPTSVVLNYAITPNTFSTPKCFELCSTCDYKVTLRITGNNDEITPIVTTQNIGPDNDCSADPYTTTSTVPLPAGEYTIERIIEANTAPSGSSVTYINSFIQAAQASLNANLLNGIGTVVDDNGVPVSGASSVIISVVLEYINTNQLNSLYTYLGAVSGDTHKNIKIGCHTIRIPLWWCPSNNCSGSIDMEAYLYDKYGAATSIDKEAILDALFPNQGYTVGDFNVVVQNMYTYGGYTCDKLWDCWKGIVATYAALNNPNNPQPATSVNIPGTSSSFTPVTPKDYLDDFLNCTGYKIEGIRATPGSGVGPEATGGYKTHPYKWFNYTSQCCACEITFYQSYVTCGVSVPPGSPINLSPPSCGSLSAFITWFNATTTNTIALPCGATGSGIITNNKEAFYKCYLNSIQNSSSVSACSINASLATNITTGTSQGTVAQCREFCDGLYNEFVSDAITLYHNQGLQVQGDAWDLVYIGPGQYEFGTNPHTPGGSDIVLNKVYCRADALVMACKQNCVLTVQPNGQLGSTTEIANIQNLLTGRFDVMTPSPSGAPCNKGYSSANQYSDSIVKTILLMLNCELVKQRKNSGTNGAWWNYYSFVNSVSSSYASLLNNAQVFVHPDIPSYFGLVPGTSSGNRIRYYFNANRTNAGTNSPKDLYTTSLLPSLPGFLFSSSGSAAVSAIVANNNPGYIFSSSFAPYSTSPAGNFMLVSDALYDATTNASPAFAISSSTTLYKYLNTGFNNKGYWSYDICSTDITGTNKLNCNESVCFKITPTPTAVPVGATQYTLESMSCQAQTLLNIANSINNQISSAVMDYATAIRTIYKQECIQKLADLYTASYSLKYHHYTLYYYDRAGNLVKTVPPAGVDASSTNRLTHPAHAMVTEYEYNSLAQLVRQKTPDAGESRFWYDAKGKLRFSQNAKQLPSNRYSYTKYDELGRITEVGEFVSATMPAQTDINNLTFPTSGGTDITRTIYTARATGITYFGNKPQRFLQNRVSYSFTDRDGDTTTTNDRVATYYSYDPHGNVEWLVSDIPEIGKNYVAYEYDLVSGSVIKVKYNEAQPDKFFHRYAYDSDKRIKTVETSRDGIFWEKDASYNYYLHGPLKRAQIGHDGIQGLDYMYTIHGWIKNVNGAAQGIDPGGDGSLTDKNMFVGRDAYSYTLGYFKNDYNSKSSAYNGSSGITLSGTDLFNGNISTMAQYYDNAAMSTGMMTGFAYNSQRTGRTFTYDELNRLKEAKFLTQNMSTFAWTNVNDYKEQFSYDANGNIMSLLRNGQAGNLNMDNMTYNYYKQSGATYLPNAQAPAPAADVTNKLSYVTDIGSTYNTDIDNQSSNNYTYDAIGNLITDAAEGITAINWNVYGKISSITKTITGGTRTITFLYDAAGNRVYKKVSESATPITGDNTTYYVRDGAGNTLSTYQRTNTGTSPNFVATFTQKEIPLYGSDRLGNLNGTVSRTTSFTTSTPPTPQQGPIAYHTSAYPYIMLPLGNNTQKQVFSRDIYTVPTTGISLGANEYLQTAITPTNLTYVHGSSQAMAFDPSGNVALSSFAYNQYTGGVLTGSQTVIYVKDKAKITNVPSTLRNSPDCQSAFVRKPGTSDEYYFFTIGGDGKPYYHVIDATLGSVLSANNELDANTDYGQTMTVFEDRVGQGITTVYMRRFYGGNSYLKMFSVTESGITPLSDVLLGAAVATSSIGEIQVSATGSKLAVANTNAAGNAQIMLYNLDASHQGVTAIASRTVTGVPGSVEFTDNDVSVFFSVLSGTTGNMYRLPVATFGATAFTTMHTQAGTAMAGAIRKGVNNMLYYVTNTTAAPTVCTLNMFTSPDAATTMLTSAISSNANGRMAMQPHLLDYLQPVTQIVANQRQLRNKEYELKDHLGNVHATFYDYKLPFSGGSPDLNYSETFNDGTTGGFAVVSGSPAGTIVDNVGNSLRVYGTGSGSGAGKTISLAASTGGKYLLSFNYNPGTCQIAQYRIDNLSAIGFVSGGIQAEGRNDVILNVPSGTGTIDLRFFYIDATAGRSFYIDDIVIKKLDETATTFISQYLNENYTTNSDWVQTNTNITYNTGTLKIARAVAGAGYYAAAKSVNLIQDQLYKVTFDVTNLSQMSPSQPAGSNKLFFGYENEDGTSWIDYTAPVANTATGTYTYYVVPKTNRGNLYFTVANDGGGSFECEIDNFKIEHVLAPFKPMYTATLSTVTDYYAFGSPMPGRNPLSSQQYRYGFNGKEKIDEVSGSGNQIDMGDRWLDVRLGRTSKPDAKGSKFPALSPYSFAANNPIFFIDPDGKVIRVHYVENGVDKYYTYKPGIKPTTNNAFVQQVHEAVTAVMKNDANKTFQNISASKETVTFNEIKTHDDKTTGKINGTGTKVTDVNVNWNPTIALQTTNGGAITPATALLHEGAHAERYINADTKAEVDALKNDLVNDGTGYDNAEEKRVIDKIETPYINATNKNQPFRIMVTPQQEGTRTDHRGTIYQSTGVNSITPADGSTQKGQSGPSETAKKMVVPANNTRVAQPIMRK